VVDDVDVEETYRAPWHICVVLPILLIVPLMRYIVRVSSVIKALSQIKKEIVAKVIEDDDAVRELCCFFPRLFT
jgi:hypothetical protein